MSVYSPAELKPVDWHRRPDGFADIRLRRNIRKVTVQPVEPEGPEEVQWVAEEQYVVADMTEAEATERFDELWSKAERDSMTTRERIEAAEGQGDDSLTGLAELGDMIAANTDAIAELGDIVATLQGGEQ